jgi:hypothetical protein
MRVAVAIHLTDAEKAKLQSYARGRSTPARLVVRAKIVLAAAAGTLNKEIVSELHLTLASPWWPGNDSAHGHQETERCVEGRGEACG